MPLRLASFSLVLLLLAALAFWPPYISKLPEGDVHTHLHAGLGLAWLLVLLGQPLLIRAGAVHVHRLIGRCAVVLGATFVISGVLVAHLGAGRMTSVQFAREGYALYLPLVMTAIFAAALALGIVWRSVSPVHGRFMACTALPLLDPLLARILYFYFPPLPATVLHQVPAFATASGILVAMYSSLPNGSPGRRAFQPFAVGTGLALLLFFLTPYSAAWFSFVSWFRSLPIT